MAIVSIRVLPDPVLRQKSKRVSLIDKSIDRLICNMVETMHSAKGVGLAAPQIGVPLRVIIISIPEQEEIALINPQIVRRSGERLVNEGCLSIPGYMGQIKRSTSVMVKGRNPQGKEIRIKANELLAQAIEHEIDHLNGILYTDRLEKMEDLHKVEPEQEQEHEEGQTQP